MLAPGRSPARSEGTTMQKYTVKKRYSATMQRGAPSGNMNIVFEKGDTVDLEDDVAAFVKRDCPGVIVRAQGVKKNARKPSKK